MLSRALAVCVLLLATTTECVAVSATNGATIASTIGTFPQLRSAIKAAGGKAVTLALSMPFDMYNGSRAFPISISAVHTHITIMGNGAVLIQSRDPFFTVGKDVTLVMVDLTLSSGEVDSNYGENNGGAINVGTGGSLTASNCVFSENGAVSIVHTCEDHMSQHCLPDLCIDNKQTL
jgi:hypothetical protein